MTNSRIRKVLVAVPLLVAPLPFLMLGCGGSSSSPAPTPVNNPAPAVVISGASSTAATGAVTFTFTFSEPVSAFPASAVTVTNGTAAASTTMVSASQYTLVVTPPANATGTMTVAVAAGAFSDSAGVASTAPASVTQLYNTVVQANAYTVLDFNSTLPSGEAYNYLDFNGDATTLVSTGYPTTGMPANVGPVVAQIVAPAVSGGAVYNGTFLGVGYENSIGALPFFASSTATAPQATKMSVVLYAPVAGVDIKLKLENALDNTLSVETDQIAVQGWQTLVFDFSQPAAGTAALNPAYTYDTAVLFPNFGVATATAGTYYVGPITFMGEAAPLAPALAQPGGESYTIMDFNSALPAGEAYNDLDFNGDGTTLVSSGYPAGMPANAGPVVAAIVTPTLTGTALYNGTYLGVGFENTVGALPFFANASATTPQATQISMVLYSPVAGVDIKLKIVNANSTGQSVETDQTAALGWQTLVFDFASPAPNTAALNATYTYDSPIIFPDFNATTGGGGTYYVGPLTFLGETGPLAPPLTAPTLAAPTSLAAAPSLPAASVIALYDSSNTYTPISIGNWNPAWGQSGSITFVTVDSASLPFMNLVNYQGVDISGPNGAATDTNPAPISIAGKLTLHMSYWTPDGTAFTFIPIDANDDQENNPVASGTLVQNAWTDLELPITSGTFDPTTLRQLKFVTAAGEHIYMDNIYFH